MYLPKKSDISEIKKILCHDKLSTYLKNLIFQNLKLFCHDKLKYFNKSDISEFT